MAGKLTSLLASRSRRAVVGAIVVAAVVTPYLILQAIAGFSIPRNTVVGAVELGGLSVASARDALNGAYPTDGALTVRIDDRNYELDLAPTTVAVDVDATVAGITRDRWNPIALLGMMFGSPRSPVLTFDEAALRASIAEFANATDIPARNANVDVDRLKVIEARPGAGIDVERARQAVLDAVAQGHGSIDLTREPRAALVSTLVAERALTDIARPAVSDSVTVSLTLPDGTVRTSVIGPDTIRTALSFVPNGSLLEPKLDGDQLRGTIDAAIFDVQTPAVDATFAMRGESVTIVASTDGFGVTSESLANDVAKVLQRVGPARAVNLTLGTIPARFTTADAEALNIKERVSWYRQRFPAAAYRTINIGTAAKRINGTILMPGDVFSMKKTVKERTAENGYTEGWIIGPDGIFKKDFGGAVSTITTAVFNAAWFAGVELVEHRAHSIYMSRYRPGREATVLWGSFDMKFKNTLANPIYITTELTKTSITVYFWGTKEYSKIDTVFGPRENQRPYPKITATLPECSEQEGSPGFRITVWRVLYKDDVEVAREPYRTSYRPSPEITCVKPKPTPTPTPEVVETSTA
jgi:vancomycin resistance protein YoaR